MSENIPFGTRNDVISFELSWFNASDEGEELWMANRRVLCKRGDDGRCHIQ